MAQYSGNLITGSAVVAANYRRAMAPFSNFGTRQIAFLAIENLSVDNRTGHSDAYVDVSDNTNIGGTGDQYAINDVSGNTVIPETGIYVTNSAIYKAISGVQLAAEVCFVGDTVFTGTAGTDQKAAFVVGIYIDTAGSANADEQHAAMANGNARTIQQAVKDATGDSGVTVEPTFPVGVAFVKPGYEY
jgi:hypothetical protein